MTKMNAALFLILLSGILSNAAQKLILPESYRQKMVDRGVRIASTLPFQKARRAIENNRLETRFPLLWRTQSDRFGARNPLFTDRTPLMGKINVSARSRWLRFNQSHSDILKAEKRASSNAVLQSDLIGTWEIIYRPEDLAYDRCFLGDEDTGACVSCGYYSTASAAQGAYDCITCTEGYEIDVVFDDCTGVCVPVGTAITPISRSDCRTLGESVEVVEFGADGQFVANTFQDGQLEDIGTSTYNVDGKHIELSDVRLYEFVDGQLVSFMEIPRNAIPGVEFEVTDDILTLRFGPDEKELHVRSERLIVEPPHLNPVAAVETLIGAWEIVYPWSDENGGYTELIELGPEGSIVRLQTAPGTEVMGVRTARYEFNDGMLREFDQESFSFDPQNQSWVIYPVYPPETVSKVYEIEGKILLVAEEQDSPGGFMVAWSGDIVVPQGIDEAMEPTDLPPPPVDDYTALTDGTGLQGKLVFTTCMGMGGDCAMVAVDVDGKNQTVLASGIQPAWSLDGSKIAFVADGLFVVDEHGTNKRRVASFLEFPAEFPSWSPDGNQIACQRINEEAMMALFEAAMEEDGMGAGFPLVFQYDVVVFDLVAGTESVVAQGQWPVWSADGQQIMYTHTGSGGLGTSQIQSIDLATGTVDPLAQGFQAILSPDGRRIAFARTDSNRTEDLDASIEEYLGSGMGMPVSIYVQTVGADDAELVVTSRQTVGTLFFLGGIRALHGWSRDSEAFLYTDMENMESFPYLALYDIGKREKTIIPGTIINPSWYDPAVRSVIEESEETTLPVSYQLSQNYPNPFNAGTVFGFTLPRKEHVTVAVYNLLGQRIASVANAVYGPGHHQFKWDAPGLVSGCYLYVMRTGNTELVHKMMILR